MALNPSKVDLIYEVTEKAIYGFFKEHRFLSNYHVCSIIYEDLEYTSTEAAYQAAKINFSDSRLRTNVERGRIAAMSPSEAKKETHKESFKAMIRPDWDDVKLDIMYEINKYKYTQHPELGEMLLETGDKYLEETNWWSDFFYGVCDGEGENQLGMMLMRIRNEIKQSNGRTQLP
jgi:ribA/ribD-fused uncharacterized protein